MKVLLILLLWAVLLALCWPLALLALVAWPFLWLLSIPFRIVATVMEALLALIKALLFCPPAFSATDDGGSDCGGGSGLNG